MAESDSDKSDTVGAETRRARRRPAEVDALILDAARDLFSSKGYAGTSSREIAQRAQVHEPSIYRRFGSKSGLFAAAILSPFGEAVSTYLESWEAQIDEPATTEQLVRSFITPLFDLVNEHRDLAVALILAHESEPMHNERPSLDVLLRRIDAQAQIETLRRGLHTSESSKLTVRVATALVIGMGLLSSWLLSGDGDLPDNAAIVDEIVRLVTYGVVERDPEGPAVNMSQIEPSPVLFNQLLDRLAAAERRAVRAELELERLGHPLGR